MRHFDSIQFKSVHTHVNYLQVKLILRNSDIIIAISIFDPRIRHDTLRFVFTTFDGIIQNVMVSI